MYKVLMPGFPGRSSRGFLGWSSVVLLEAGGEHVLFDCGPTGARQHLLETLRGEGLTPDRIDRVVLSHLHFDHIGNLECFPDAEIVLHASELDYFRAHGRHDPAMAVYQVEGLLQRANMVVVEEEPELLPGVRMIRTPGHTGGHCSLLLTAGARRVVLAQDAVKHRGELAGGAVAGAFSLSDAAASIARIRKLADLVVPGHDAPLSLQDGRVGVEGTTAVELTVTWSGKSIVWEA